MKYVDLYGIVPDISIDYGNPVRSEREVITPALVAAGYTVGEWRTGERDAFGPLSRFVNATGPGGEEVAIVYG